MDQLLQQLEQDALPSETGLWWLIGAAVLTVVLWQFPLGNYLLYPFTILATWFHEMCHGVTAMLLGGRFTRLEIYARGSGVAFYTTDVWLGSVGKALVAAGGPMGPPLAGALFLVASRNFQVAHWTLVVLGVLLLLTTVWWVRSLFGLLAVPLWAAAVLAVAAWAAPAVQVFAVQFLGVQACVSTFHQVRYLFTERVRIGNKLALSDSGQVADNLFGPYWLWGGLMSAATLAILVFGLRAAYGR